MMFSMPCKGKCSDCVQKLQFRDFVKLAIKCNIVFFFFFFFFSIIHVRDLYIYLQCRSRSDFKKAASNVCIKYRNFYEKKKYKQNQIRYTDCRINGPVLDHEILLLEKPIWYYMVQILSYRSGVWYLLISNVVSACFKYPNVLKYWDT